MQPKQRKKHQTSPKTSAAEPTNYEDIRRIVLSWPLAQRTALAHDILNTLEQQTEAPRPRRKTLHLALGLADTGQTPPSDEEVEQWLEEYRLKKYG